MSTQFKQELTEEVARQIAQLPDDVEPRTDDVVEIARAMVGALPRRTTYDALVGPFYDIAGVRRLFGDVTRQAVDQRRRRNGLLRVITRDHHSLFPVFQFDRGRVRPEVLDLLGPLGAIDDQDGWIRATWFATPAAALDGQTPRQVVTDPAAWERYGSAAVDLAVETADRWSAAA
ncbi:hypothetical protein [Isoptericola sp. NPDC055881]